MNIMYSNQECSSGCESGWTLYLEDHSSIDFVDARKRINPSFSIKLKRSKQETEETEDEEEEEEEDLSMVSDASSGPPHFQQDNNNNNNGCFYNFNIDPSLSINSLNRQKKIKEKNPTRQVKDRSSLLDDTASSPLFDFSSKSYTMTRSQHSVGNEYSQGYSSTQFEVRPQYQEQYDFFQSSLSEDQLHQNQLS
ncbi:hypothetical protein ACJIZ3_001245 [Penstemon smallii]|uniref:Uncharacterized protein n=1 Tax=Penstemon smallii TaxID=265156 RepID=A0ABD3U376_9LAMI